MKRAIFYTIILLALQMFGGLIVMGIWKLVTGEDPSISVPCTIVMTLVGDVMAIVLFLKAKWSVVSPHWIRTRPWAVLCWCSVAAIGLLVPSGWIQELMPELPNLLEDTFEGLIANPWGYVVIGLTAPFVEELVFRGAVLRTLLKWRENPWIGICISAALFALIHMNPAQMPHAFLIGLLLGWMYYRTDSIIPGVVYHWVNNSIAFGVGHVMMAIDPASNGDLTMVQLFGSNARVLMALGCSMMIVIPAIYQLNLRMKK